MPFDQIQVGQQRFSLEGFLELPLPERVKHILLGDLHFFRDGQPIDRREALNALRANRATAS